MTRVTLQRGIDCQPSTRRRHWSANCQHLNPLCVAAGIRLSGAVRRESEHVTARSFSWCIFSVLVLRGR